MKKKPSFVLYFRFIYMTTGILLSAMSVHAQVINLGEDQIKIGEDSEISSEDFLSENRKLIITPKEGNAIAHAEVQQGTQTILVYAQKITVIEKTKDFTLEQNAKIERGSTILIGPEKIVYDSHTATLTLFGTRKNPASVQYPEFSYNGKAAKYYLYGKMVEGHWQLVDFKTEGHVQSSFGSFSSKPETKSAPQPRISPPKK